MFRVGEIKPFSFALRYLSFFKCFPKTEEERQSKKFIYVALLLKICPIIFCLTTSFLHLIHFSTDCSESVGTSGDGVIIFGGIAGVGMCIMFILLNGKWYDFLNRLLDFSVSGGPPHGLKNTVNRVNICCFSYASSVTVAACIYGGISYSDTANCLRLNEEHNLRLLCGTYFPVWLPFDIPLDSSWLIIFLIQFHSVLSSGLAGAMIIGIIYEATEIIFLHLQQLKSRFKGIIDDKIVRPESDSLGSWINYHNHILSMAKELIDLAYETAGFASFSAAILFGYIENQMMTEELIEGTMIFCGFMIALALLCYLGQRLVNETLSVQDAVLESNWYLADIKTKKAILMIIQRAQKPVYFKCFPFRNVDFPFLVVVLQTSFSYMTFLSRTS